SSDAEDREMVREKSEKRVLRLWTCQNARSHNNLSIMDTLHRVVIVGGGFGGLTAARRLRRAAGRRHPVRLPEVRPFSPPPLPGGDGTTFSGEYRCTPARRVEAATECSGLSR